MERGTIWCADRVLVADALRTRHIGERMIGLLGCRALPPGSGLLIAPCGSVHTIGMRFALDLVFMDAVGRVVRTVAGVRPWRCAVWGGLAARQTLEVQAGWLGLSELAGRTLHWSPSGNTRKE